MLPLHLHPLSASLCTFKQTVHCSPREFAKMLTLHCCGLSSPGTRSSCFVVGHRTLNCCSATLMHRRLSTPCVPPTRKWGAAGTMPLKLRGGFYRRSTRTNKKPTIWSARCVHMIPRCVVTWLCVEQVVLQVLCCNVAYLFCLFLCSFPSTHRFYHAAIVASHSHSTTETTTQPPPPKCCSDADVS